MRKVNLLTLSVSLFLFMGCGQVTKPCGRLGFTGTVINAEGKELSVLEAAGENPNAKDIAGRFYIDFTFDPAQCDTACRCGQYWFIQMFRVLDASTGEVLPQPNGDQTARAITNAGPGPNGWAIDRPQGGVLGYYKLDANWNLESDGETPPPYRFGTSSQSAQMRDTVVPGTNPPSQWKGKELLIQGVTLAVCIQKNSDCFNKVLAMEHWDINIHKNGHVDAPKGHLASVAEQDVFQKAVDQWNNHLGSGRQKLAPFTFAP